MKEESITTITVKDNGTTVVLTNTEELLQRIEFNSATGSIISNSLSFDNHK